MYENCYGLAENPFSLAPDPRYFYKGAAHAGAVELVGYAIERGEAFLTVTGDAGTGKTTLCRALPELLGHSVLTALVLEPVLSEHDLLRVLLQEFGLVSRAQAARGALASVSTEKLIDTLQEFVRSLELLGARALVAVDDAQHLAAPVLELIRTLAKADDRNLFHVLLAGQSAFLDRLRTPELRSLQQRLSMRHELKPLSRDETSAYVAHRLAIAGGSEALSFSAGALGRVYGCTRGVPRLVNLLCDRALVAACADRSTRIRSGHIDRAADALDLARPRRLLLAWAR